MEYDIDDLVRSVLGHLGERHQGSGAIPFPTIADAIELKVKSLLPAVGRRLIADASVLECGGWETSSPYAGPDVEMHRMPCGLYACDIPMPEDTVRILSVRMASWKQSASGAIMPGDAGWGRQWSAEPGIAGCTEHPRAYLMQEEGLRLRCMGSRSEEDTPLFINLLRIPTPDEDGIFRFPALLYPELISDMAKEL